MKKSKETSAIFSTHPVKVFKKIIEGKSKKKVFKYYDIESLNSNFISKFSNNIKYKNIYILSDLNKSFTNFEKTLINNNNSLSKLNFEINQLVEKLEFINQFAKKIYFFGFPLDIDDNYFGDLNSKAYGKNWLINNINLKIGSKISRYDSLNLIDVNELVIKSKYTDPIFDQKMKYLIGSNFSPNYINFLADEIFRRENKKTQKIKHLIFDLDNTLWGGEAGERDYNKLELGPSSIKGQVYSDFQTRIKNLKNKGFVLSICSKNNFLNVKKVFTKNKNMKVKLSDFSCVKVNWKSKNENIKEILNELNLRQENSLFIDDNKFEREIVKKDLTQINIFEFPINILELNQKFNKLEGLNKQNITETDQKRTVLYHDEKKRKNLKKIFNLQEWIKRLNIKLNVKKINNFERAEEMFKRTNQFNISHIERSKSELMNLSKNKDYICLEISMLDKFGDYGFISLIIINLQDKKYIIEDFLLSCRVFERNIEPTIFNFIKNLKPLRNKIGFIRINRNEKNKYVQDLFKSLNFLKINGKSTFKIINKINFNKNIKIS